jgi:hypothetical protein
MPRLNRSSYYFIAIIVVLLAVIGGGIAYVVPMRWENARLRSRVARLEEKSAEAPSFEDEGPLSATQRRAMFDALVAETGPTRDVWFTYDPTDSSAAAYERALQGVFEEAGWKVRANSAASFSLKPGIFFLMADDVPPAYVLTALSAFRAADIEVSAGQGYRAFHEKMKKDNPNYRGFELADDQAYIVAVGRQP